MPFHFAGTPPYIERAAAELGLKFHPELVQQDKALYRVGSQVAQAVGPGYSPGQAAEILSHAERARDTLAVLHRAAELIVAEAKAAVLPPPEPEPAPEPEPRRPRRPKDQADA